MTENTEEITIEAVEATVEEPEVAEPTLEQQLTEMKDMWLRAKADVENQRRRSFDDMAIYLKWCLN